MLLLLRYYSCLCLFTNLYLLLILSSFYTNFLFWLYSVFCNSYHAIGANCLQRYWNQQVRPQRQQKHLLRHLLQQNSQRILRLHLRQPHVRTNKQQLQFWKVIIDNMQCSNACVPSQSYGASPATGDHTVSPATRHK